MSLLVDVREVPWRLFWDVRARILANREAQRRRMEAQQLRGHTRPRPQQRVFGATMSTYRRPEPAPAVLGTPDGVLLAFWYFGGFTFAESYAWDFYVESTDRSSRVRKSWPYDNDGAILQTWCWCMPAGGNAAIMVFTDAHPQPNRVYTPTWWGVLVSEGVAREIPVPGAFRSKVLAAGAFEFGFSQAVPNSDGVVTNYAFMPLPLDIQLEGSQPNPSAGWISITPGVFARINRQGSVDASYQDGLEWAKANFLQDAPTPRYALTTCKIGNACEPNTLRFDKLPYLPASKWFADPYHPDGEPADRFVPSGIKPIRFDINNPQRPLQDGLQMAPATLYVWDWGQPAYCRQQLAALGFRPEDMRP